MKTRAVFPVAGSLRGRLARLTPGVKPLPVATRPLSLRAMARKIAWMRDGCETLTGGSFENRCAHAFDLSTETTHAGEETSTRAQAQHFALGERHMMNRATGCHIGDHDTTVAVR